MQLAPGLRLFFCLQMYLSSWLKKLTSPSTTLLAAQMKIAYYIVRWTRTTVSCSFFRCGKEKWANATTEWLGSWRLMSGLSHALASSSSNHFLEHWMNCLFLLYYICASFKIEGSSRRCRLKMKVNSNSTIFNSDRINTMTGVTRLMVVSEWLESCTSKLIRNFILLLVAVVCCERPKDEGRKKEDWRRRPGIMRMLLGQMV